MGPAMIELEDVSIGLTDLWQLLRRQSKAVQS